ncbi:MAG TPA: hypothetical protein VNB86_11315 [Gaiellaceae bacterium]|nr:hypothetical protein [Gaiellaceae bacterium]
MRRRIVLAAVVALVPAGAAFAHGPHGVNGTGYVASVKVVDPQVVGLEAKVILDDQLLVSNLTRKPLQILDRSGRPFIRFRPSGVERLLDGEWRHMNSGAAYAWHDSRVVGSGTPPPVDPGAAETAPRFVRNWTVPGRVGAKAFAIEGALAWVEPPRQQDEGVSTALLVGGALALAALSLGAMLLLGRRRQAG